ncbi:baeRF7 domain-containing protein [Gudongella sp. SC589]|jgi:hypothetical protein|uniref:baeRF7 domain-containing protein n=1 Tax=Gudongella sp. SC589 TaxID=3385990 RepID=UPI0039048732
MEKLDLDVLKELSQMDLNGLVSIYLPTFKQGQEANQSRIRLKNLIRDAEESLVENGFSEKVALALLKPATKLLDETIFWQNQELGLGIFLSPEEMRYYKLPFEVEELAIVSNRFYIRPLLKLFTSIENFNVLTLSQAEVKLFEANPYGIKKIEVPEIDELVENYIPANELHQEATSPKGAASGGGPGMHGYNEMSKTEKNEISKHLRSIDKEVNKVLKDTKHPLIVYSVDYIYPMYREVSSYPNLMEESIKGSPEGVGEKEIHQKAVDVFKPRVEKRLEKEIEKFMTLLNTDSKLGTDSIERIVLSSNNGGVDTLFIAEDVQKWGVFNEEDNSLDVNNKEDVGHVDLMDKAAMLTLSSGGTVHVLQRDKMPSGKPIAAVLRF